MFGPSGVLELDPYSEVAPRQQEILVSFQGAALSPGSQFVYLTVPHVEKLGAGAVMIYDLATRRVRGQVAVGGISPYAIVCTPPPAALRPQPPGKQPGDER
jgi:hypothetical protein